ncbi:MAG: hypothetical protein LBS07_04180, partial [Prevotellaceae bacterium]|nr:hypothetical protein [Prevotellaceae bacterium]
MKKISLLFSSFFLFSFLAFSSKIIHLDYRIKLGFVTAGKADFFLGDTLFQDKPLKYTKVLAQTTSVA